MAVRSRTSFGHDQRLICEISDGHALLRCERVMLGDRDDGCLMKEKHEFQALVGPFGRPDESKVKPAGQQPRQQAYGLVLDQLNTDIRSLHPEILQQHRQQSSCCTIDRTHANSCSLLSAAHSEFGSESFGCANWARASLRKAAPSSVRVTLRVVRIISRVPRSSW